MNAYMQSVMIKAAREGDLPALEALCTDAAVVQRWGEEALAEACQNGELEAAQFLHAQGVKVDGFYLDPNNAGQTIHSYPLYCAIMGRHWRVVEWLLDLGVTADHLRWSLAPLVEAGEVALFIRVLGTHDYVAEFLRRDALSQALDIAIRALLTRDSRPGIAACIAAGLPPAQLIHNAIGHSASGVLRDLLEMGVTPDAGAVNVVLQKPPGSMEQNETCRLLRAWCHDLPLDSATADHYAQALRADPQARSAQDSVPAAVALSRAGHFKEHVAPLLAVHGSELLLMQDGSGCTVADIAARRGELAAAFDAAIWQGRVTAALTAAEALPERVKKHIDLGEVTGDLRRAALAAGVKARPLKL